MKKLLVFCLILVNVMLFMPLARGSEYIVVSIENNLSVPIYKTFTFEIDKQLISNFNKFVLLDNSTPLPLYFRDGTDKVYFKSAIALGANEKKTLQLVPSSEENGSVKEIYVPNFIGTRFVIPQKGRVFVVSYANGNHILIKDTKTSKIIFDKNLDLLEFTFFELTSDSIYDLSSSLPIFAEFSTLTPPFDKNSSDDVSAVYGNFFKLYIPKLVFITTTSETSLKITDSKGNIIVDTTLKKNSYYMNQNLQEGVYTIVTDKPVLVEFGYAEDNVFSILYGVDSSNIISFRGLGISSIFDDTSVSIKFDGKSTSFKLDKANDFKYFDIIASNDFKPNETEFKEVLVDFSKPVLIYTYSQFGNVDGEQIPGFNNSTNFKFHTGKVTKIYGERKRRVVVVPIQDGTQLNFNGVSYTQNAYQAKTFLFSDSFSSVNVSSNKPVAVFDLGIDNNKEIFTTLIPLVSYEPFTLSILSQNNASYEVNQGASNNATPTNTSTNNFLENVKTYLLQIFTRVSAFFVGAFSQDNLKTVVDVISTFFKGVSSNILGFLRPISEKIYPYVKNYVPNITVDMISSIIFFAFIVLVVILLIPKGKKKQVPVVSVEEVKKKPISFNVKDLEIREGEASEDLTLPKAKVEEAPKVKTIPIKPPEEVVKEAPKEEIEPARRVFRPVPPKRTEKLTLEKETKAEETKVEVSKPTKKLEEEVPQKPEVLEKPEESTQPAVEEEKTVEKHIEEKIEIPPSEEMATLPEEVSKIPLTEEVKEKPKVEEVKEEPKTEEVALGKAEEVQPQKGEVAKEEVIEQNEPSFADFAQPDVEKVKEVEEIESKIKEVEKEEEKEEVTKKEEFKSTFEELLKKLEEENRRKKEVKKEEALEEVKEKVVNEQEESHHKIEEEKSVKIEIKTKFVGDASTLRKIYERNDVPQSVKNDLLSKACISASQKAEVSDIAEGRYRITVIGLTTIEERLAEDIAKRVSGKYTTGEAILIAKKLRLTEVVVDDNPKLKNYQGITIYSLDDII